MNIGLPPTKEKVSQKESFAYTDELVGRSEEDVLGIGGRLESGAKSPTQTDGSE